MTKKTILITGASGFLGQAVNRQLQQQGYQTIGWRHKRRTECDDEVSNVQQLVKITQQVDYVINLAGAPIAARAWSGKRRQQLLDSRLAFTEQLVRDMKTSGIACRHFISGSAIGIYGSTEHPVTEQSAFATDFAAELCCQWERAAATAEGWAGQVSYLRTGLVLGNNGGFLEPFKRLRQLHLKLQFGDGKQGQSWISLSDWLAGLQFVMERSLPGAINLTAPHPVDHEEFLNILFHGKSALPLAVPGLFFKPLGEMKQLFIEGQFVLPQRLLDEGFSFQHSSLADALAPLL